ncbi:hypothetical protein KIS1582_3842 [Cytobacillus firmus]|uniref:Uncharacterized protein n=1 Tax=Cytobacillus firmus TaxID=1399 RepID=A0A800MU48_CYTFI|nr:hypothetical protein KIS1582_3842 [Cytobacillus firmus]
MPDRRPIIHPGLMSQHSFFGEAGPCINKNKVPRKNKQ